MPFDQLILRKIIEILATRCQILTLKCTKIDFGWGSAPDPAGGAYSAPPDPLAGFKGPTSKGRGREGEGREGKWTGGGKGRDGTPPTSKLVVLLHTVQLFNQGFNAKSLTITYDNCHIMKTSYNSKYNNAR